MYIPNRLLLSLIEHSRDESESRCNGRFSNPEEEAGYHQSGETGTGGVAHQNTSPEEAGQLAVIQTEANKTTYTEVARYFPIGNRTIT